MGRWLAEKASYRHGQAAYPQVLQGDEYAPAEAIQVMYVSLAGSKRNPAFGSSGMYEWTSNGKQIFVKGPVESLSVGLADDNIVVGRRPFKDGATVLLFHALARVLGDVGERCEPQGIRGTWESNRAYRDAITIEFGYPLVVVQLVALSNGAGNPERLYVLDLIRRTDSRLWKE